MSMVHALLRTLVTYIRMPLMVSYCIPPSVVMDPWLIAVRITYILAFTASYRPFHINSLVVHFSMEHPRANKRKELQAAVGMVEDIIRNHQHNHFSVFNAVNTLVYTSESSREEETRASYNMSDKMPAQVEHMNRLTMLTDVDCINNLRMDRNAFGRLCRILCDRCGLVDQRYVRVEEQVAMFLHTLAHHTKNRVVGFQFLRSKHTVSRYIHEVMRGVIHLHSTLFVQPSPVDDNCDDHRWKWFKVNLVLSIQIDILSWSSLLSPSFPRAA